MKILENIFGNAGRATPWSHSKLRFGKLLVLLSSLLITDVIAGPPPTDWELLLPSQVLPYPFHPAEFDVAHGNGTFVGGGGYGAVATSPDGVTWTPVLPGTFDYFTSVAFGAGTFVAVGGADRISTSTDGVNWQNHPGVGTYDQLFRVRFLGGLFVATGTERLFTNGIYAGVLYTSPNGLDWTQRLRLLPPEGWDDIYPAGIAYGNGRFVAAWAQQGPENAWDGFTYTSSDGIVWTQADPNPSLTGPVDLVYGNGGFILLDSNRVLTSPDGTAWELRHELEDSFFWMGGIASSSNRIVCFAEEFSDQEGAQRLAVVSEDGILWQQSPLPGNVPRQVFSDGATFFAFGERSALSSSDGIAWTEHFTPHPLDQTLTGLRDVAYGDQGFIAVGSGGTILASPDGLAWEMRASGTVMGLGYVAHGEGRYVAAGGNGTLVHSTDGDTWTPADLDGVTLPLGPIVHGADRFVLVTRTSGNGFFWTSDDGVNWQVRFSDALNLYFGLSSVAFGNGRFVATGEHHDNTNGTHGAIAVSEDGITWERFVIPEPYRTYSLTGILFDGTRFLAYDFWQGLMASPDGLAWTALDERAYTSGLGHGGGNVVALRGTQENSWHPVIGLLESSVDASSWTVAAPFQFGEGSMEFAYGAGRFVGVGTAFQDAAILIVSDFTAPLLLPRIDLKKDDGRLMLRIRGTAGSTWDLQQSSTLSEWQTLQPLTLGAESLDIEVFPAADAQGFWRLAAPAQ